MSAWNAKIWLDSRRLRRLAMAHIFAGFCVSSCGFARSACTREQNAQNAAYAA
jgi:hypothetical protein